VNMLAAALASSGHVCKRTLSTKCMSVHKIYCEDNQINKVRNGREMNTGIRNLKEREHF